MESSISFPASARLEAAEKCDHKPSNIKYWFWGTWTSYGCLLCKFWSCCETRQWNTITGRGACAILMSDRHECASLAKHLWELILFKSHPRWTGNVKLRDVTYAAGKFVPSCLRCLSEMALARPSGFVYAYVQDAIKLYFRLTLETITWQCWHVIWSVFVYLNEETRSNTDPLAASLGGVLVNRSDRSSPCYACMNTRYSLTCFVTASWPKLAILTWASTEASEAWSNIMRNLRSKTKELQDTASLECSSPLNTERDLTFIAFLSSKTSFNASIEQGQCSFFGLVHRIL